MATLIVLDEGRVNGYGQRWIGGLSKMAARTTGLRMGWRKRAFPAMAGTAVLLAAIVLLFFSPNALDRFGLQLFDHFQRSAPREYQDMGVRVIDIDEESIRRIGQWPWPRTQIADMTKRAVDSGAQIVAFDMVFSEPDRTSPENLTQVFSRGGAGQGVLEGLKAYRSHDEVLGETFSELPIVLAYFFERAGEDENPLRRVGPVVLGESPVEALPQYASMTGSLDVIEGGAYDAGFVSVEKDADNIVRSAPMLASLKGEIYPSLSLTVLRLVAEATGQNAGSYLIKTTTASGELAARNAEVISVRVGEFEVPTTPDGRMWMRYTASKENRVIPAWKLLDPETPQAELEDAFMGTIVFVGAGAQGLQDLVATPFNATTPGVLVHAQALEQMLLGDFLRQPDWAGGIRMLALLAGGIILILMIPITGPMVSGVIGAVIVTGLFGVSWTLYADQALLFDPVYPALALLAVYGVTSLVSFVVAEAEKSHIKDAFDHYLSPEMVSKIADDPSQLVLGGEERDMTILFSDIRSFSKISEGMTPEELTTYLNRYLTPMTDILMSHQATVDKYIGDAIMSFWNAPIDDPDHHKNAARAALHMMQKLEAMNARAGQGNFDDPDTLPVATRVGIGLHSGRTSVGNMGSAQRFAYSVLGDTVNTASRLEGMTKQYGIGILVGDETAAHLPDFAVVEVDRAKAVGKDTWLTIFGLMGDEQMARHPDFAKLKAAQSEFLEVYRGRDFDLALTACDECALLGDRFALGPYYEIMKARIEGYRNDPPPEDWDGVYVLREK